MRLGSQLRILDFQGDIEGIRFGAVASVLWPFNAIKISIPVRRRRETNIFEDTICRLAQAERVDIQRFSELTCLHPDLVGFILARLVAHGYLTDRWELTEGGKALVARADDEESECKAAVIFVDMVGGELLPMIASSDLNYAEVFEARRLEVTFRKGKRSIKARKLYYNEEHFQVKPNAAEIAQKAVEFARRRRYSFPSKGPSKIPEFNGSETAISISGGNDLVFLHVRLLIQEDTAEYRVTDPFGHGFSNLLEGIHRKLVAGNEKEGTAIVELKERALFQRLVSRGAHGSSKLSMFGDTLQPYPNVRRALERAENGWGDSSIEVRTSEQEKERQAALSRCVRSLYAALEWALSYVVTKSSLSRWFSSFCGSGSTYEDNGKTLLKFAGKIGLQSKSATGFLKVSPGRIRAALDSAATDGHGTPPDMESVVALALAEASCDSRHPFALLAAGTPDWMIQLLDMKRARDAASHLAFVGYDRDRIEVFREFTHFSIECLLASVARTDSTGTEAMCHDRDVCNKRLQARIALDRRFGVAVMYAKDEQDEQLRELLVQAELQAQEFLRHDDQEPDCSEMVNALASALQNRMHAEIVASDLSAVSGSAGADVDTEGRARRSGFQMALGGLPTRIATARQDRVEAAARGQDSTLGANTSAFLMVASDARLVALAERLPGLLLLVEDLSSLRHHANEPVPMPRAAAVELKDRVYEAIQKLEEE